MSPASSHLRPAPSSVSPPATPMSPDPFILSPASSTLCSVSPASCTMSPASPTPTCHLGPPDTPLASLSGEQEATAASRSTPPTPVPQEISNRPEIGEVYLELQVGAVEGVSEFSSPCQRSAYSPSQWQGLNFTLSPSAFPATPAQLLLLSPKDSSPMLQSPPLTIRPLPLPEDRLKSGCTADRNPVSPAHHPVGSAPTDHTNAQLRSPPTVQSPEAVSLLAPAAPVPQEVSSHIGEVYLEPQVGAVEGDGEFSSPGQRSAYSPSQWQGLNFTLSPSAFPLTPARLLLLSPNDSSPMVQSPPPTTRPLPQPLDHLTPGCVTDRCSQAAARVQMSPAVAETSDVSDVPGLDFDSPDVPNKRCGLLPRAAVTMETWPSPATQTETSGLECKNMFEGDVTGGTE
ncbi:hypothetical protein GJAV_G00222850 [Gymnothorax javanicus]|nr:hypothetical protein GJAV_G00222850 [Gymnothorax javanicus]